MTKKEAAALLPTGPTQSQINPARLKIALIAEPKWGKTKFFMSNPNSLLLAFEEGHAFQRGHKIVIDRWDASIKEKYRPWTDENGVNHMTFKQAVESLEAIKGKFDCVIIDTADMAAKMCADYHLSRKGFEHLQDAGEYGKGYDTCLNTPFRQMMGRVLKTGRGIGFIGHTKIEIAKYSTGERARKEMRLPGGVKYFIESQADLILHGELGKKRDGNRLRDRILVCEGDSDIMAGNRSERPLPQRFIVKPTGAWAQFKQFFTDDKAVLKAEEEFLKHYRK